MMSEIKAGDRVILHGTVRRVLRRDDLPQGWPNPYVTTGGDLGGDWAEVGIDVLSMEPDTVEAPA
jgi:hypothetical protein